MLPGEAFIFTLMNSVEAGQATQEGQEYENEHYGEP